MIAWSSWVEVVFEACVAAAAVGATAGFIGLCLALLGAVWRLLNVE